MIINVAELRKEKANVFNYKEIIDLSKENSDEYAFKKPIEVELEVKLLRDEVLLKVEYSSEVEYTCVKCLKKFDEKIEGKFETEFLNKEDYEMYIKADEKEHYFDSNEVLKEELVKEQINTETLIRDFVILNINEYPVCKIECSGLEEFETYKNDGIDPRFQKLLDIVNNSSKI